MSARMRFFVGATALACFLHVGQALACQPCNETWSGYVLDLGDGQHVFVMKNPDKVMSVCLSSLSDGVFPTKAEAEVVCHREFTPEQAAESIFFPTDATETELKAICCRRIAPTDPQDHYPHSGVYSTDSPHEPVWKWEGEYLSRRAVKQGISPDGRFLVLAHIPDSTDKPALLIYDLGQVSQEFSLSRFVNDLSQIPKPFAPCGCGPGPTWYRTWNLDHATAQLTVETHGDRIVVIDVTTGEVPGNKQITRVSVDGLAVLKDGKRIGLSDVGNCGFVAGIMGMDIVRRPDGLTDVPALVGYRVNKTFGNTNRSLDMLSIPLDAVRTATPADRKGEDPPVLRVTLTNGETLDVTVEPVFWVLCGKNASGEKVSIPFDDLQT